jgi:cation diffusion facilitator family transporter
MSDHGGSIRTILFALGANFAIAIAKTIAAIMSGSGSMAAEAVHSFADCGNQLLLLLGLRQALRPADTEHPLGYGRAIYFWSFIVALMLFSAGGLFSIYEGWHKLAEGEPLTSPWVAIGVLVFSLVAESIALQRALQQIKAVRGELSLWQWFRSTRQSELLVIFGEDVAATFGLVLALVAVGVAVVTGNPIYDAFGSMAIGVLLIVVAVFIGIEVQALLLGRSADPGVEQRLHAFIEARPEVDSVLNLITTQHGEDVIVAVKAKMVDQPSARALVDAINDCERALRTEFPQVRWLFFEPDVTK